MASAQVKRNIKDAEIVSSNPSKKRKLNEDERNDSSSTATNTASKKSSSNTNGNAPEAVIPFPSKDTASSTTNAPKTQSNDNDNPSNWSFKASDFTFASNGWVKQTSDPNSSKSETSKEQSTEKDVVKSKVVPNEDSFSGFIGQGFGKELEAKKKEEEEKEKGEKTDETKTDNPWAQNWSNSNSDGSFKLNFEWGTWEDSNTKIDLNPANPIKFGSEADVYDPNKIESDDKTKEVLESMTGEQDTGDADDENVYSVHCKVYNLENGKYAERGKGTVHVNTYKVEDKLKGRILCRRDQILTTIINAPILKEMKFEKTGNFLRFCVLEQANENDKKEEGKEKTFVDQEKEKEDENEDDDIIKAKVVPYLVKPSGGATKVDEMIEKIKEIQEKLS